MREIIGIFPLLITVIWHYRQTETNALRPYYFIVVAIKLLAGVAVGLVYTYYYNGGDTWAYFYQAELISKTAFINKVSFIDFFIKSNYHAFPDFAYAYQPRAALMVKFVALVNLLTNSNYWLSSMYFSFASFVGVFTFATWVNNKFEHGKLAAILLVVWPSFVFWSSGILKESLAVGLIFWIIPTFLRTVKSRKITAMLYVLVGFVVLFAIKYYYAVALTVVLVIYIISCLLNLRQKNLFLQIITWVLLIGIGSLLGGFLHPNLKVTNIIGVMIQNNEAFMAKSDSISVVHFWSAKNQWVWLLINAPKALIASLFLPLGFAKNGLIYIFAVLENWLLLILFVRGVYQIQWSRCKIHSDLVLASIAYICMLAVFLALSTPNLGTLSRYKVAFMPVLLILLILANTGPTLRKSNSKN